MMPACTIRASAFVASSSKQSWQLNQRAAVNNFSRPRHVLNSGRSTVRSTVLRVSAYQQGSQGGPPQRQLAEQKQKSDPQQQQQQPTQQLAFTKDDSSCDLILRFKNDERVLYTHSPILRVASKTFEVAMSMENEIVGSNPPPAEEMPPVALAAAQRFTLDITSKRIEHEGGRIRVVHTLQVPQDQALTAPKIDEFLRLVHAMFAARRTEKPADVINWSNVRGLLETSEHLGADAVVEALEEWLLNPPAAATPAPWDASDDELLAWLVQSDRLQIKRLTSRLVGELAQTGRIQRIIFGPQWDFSTHSVQKDQSNRASSTTAIPANTEQKQPTKVVDNKLEQALKHLRPETVADLIVRRERNGRSTFRRMCAQLAPNEAITFSNMAG